MRPWAEAVRDSLITLSSAAVKVKVVYMVGCEWGGWVKGEEGGV